jgi:signal transduction histidine kinase
MAGKTSKPTFFWQGVLILLPVLLMAGFGTWAILRERRAVESDARQRAREILQSPLPYFFERGLVLRFDYLAVLSSGQSWIPENASQLATGEEDGSVKVWGGAGNMMPGEMTNGSGYPSYEWQPSEPNEVWPMNFLLDAGGNFRDLTWQDAPQPPDWFTSLNEEQRVAWTALRESDLKHKLGSDISARVQDFLNTAPPASARECAEFISLRARADSQSNLEALDSLLKFATNCSDAETESGVPLSNLVLAEVLRRAKAPSTPIEKQLEFEVRFRPSVLTPALLDEAERFAAADLAFAERLKVLRAIGRTRELQRELAEIIKRTGVRTETGSMTNLWIQTPEQRWFCILQPEQVAKARVREEAGSNKLISAQTNTFTEVLPFPEPFLAKSLSDSLDQAGISLPGYFGISIELEGRAVNLPARWSKPPVVLPGGHEHLPPEARDVMAEREITLSQPGSRGDGTNATLFEFLPSHPRLTLRVVLADRRLLYARQTARQLIFGTLIALSAVAALIGFVMARRAFTTQLQLSEAKSNFVSSVSHELRAPIASVRLMAESLERGKVNEAPKQNEYFRFIVQECRRLSSLIENVLDFSRIEQGRKQYEFEPTDVAALTRETVKLMEPYAAEKDVRLELDTKLESKNPELELDGRAMQQALVNLMDNAIKHSPKGAVVKIGFECDGSLARLWVEDLGPGIPPEEHEKIFERFYRLGSELRRETQGVGIGLSIVRHIVEAHGGKVTVRSSVGQGSRFTIELQVINAKTQSSEGAKDL